MSKPEITWKDSAIGPVCCGKVETPRGVHRLRKVVSLEDIEMSRLGRKGTLDAVERMVTAELDKHILEQE